MKITVTKEFDILNLHVNAEVRYWEDAEINGIRDKTGDFVPFKEGHNWCPVIDIESGRIKNWPKGCIAKIHFKVCDCCGFEIKDENNNTIAKNEGYVPDILCPAESNCGDRIVMDINEGGEIDGWDADKIIELL